MRHFFSLATSHDTLNVQAQSRVTVRARFDHIDLAGSPAWETVARRLRFRQGVAQLPAAEFVHVSPHVSVGTELEAYARESFTPGRPIGVAAVELMKRIYHEFDYAPESTLISTPPLEVFTMRHGVCQDFSHVMIGCLRSVGLAARYVSGYLVSAPAPGDAALIGSDAIACVGIALLSANGCAGGLARSRSDQRRGAVALARALGQRS